LSSQATLGRFGQDGQTDASFTNTPLSAMEAQENQGGVPHPLPSQDVLQMVSSLGVDPRIFDPRSQLQETMYISVPEKYQDPDQSGLAIEVKNRQQIYDIDLR
jgi:hypothetical protein